VTGRVVEPRRRRASTDSDEGSSAATLDDVGVKHREQVPVSTPPLSAALSGHAANVTGKQLVDRSTSAYDKVNRRRRNNSIKQLFLFFFLSGCQVVLSQRVDRSQPMY